MEITVNIPEPAKPVGGLNYKTYIVLLIDKHGNASIEFEEKHESDKGTTFDRYYGAELEWCAAEYYGVWLMPDRKACEALAKKIAPLVERVQSGREVYRNDNGYWASDLTTDDAGEASQEIESLLAEEGRYLVDDEAEVYDAAEWLWGDDSIEILLDVAGVTLEQAATASDEIKRTIAENLVPDGITLMDLDEAIEGICTSAAEELEWREE